ncbi:uncharacterized protein [Dermacentor albipictus]|uniref:uncharacterized protein isoform X2 n=1 Tax=Dermacentor albipictus TaxID=60249 RepID=UPI0038FCCF2C
MDGATEMRAPESLTASLYPYYFADDVGTPYGATPYTATPYGTASQWRASSQSRWNQETELSDIGSDRPWKVLLLACALLLFCSGLIVMFMGTLTTATTDEDATGTGDGDDSTAVSHIIYRTPSRPVTRGTRSGSGASSRTIRTATPVTTPAAIPPPVTPFPPADEDATSTGDGNHAVTHVIYRTPSRPANQGTRGTRYEVPGTKVPGTSASTIGTASRVTTPAAIPPSIAPLPPVKYRPPQAHSMICTVGCHGKYAVEFPPDGMCDFIFLDSLYDGCPDQFVQHRSPSSSWRRFQALAASGIKTQFGISIDTLSVFMPDAIVVLGHTSFQENKIPSLRCVLLPPNIHKIPPGVREKITHAHTFVEAGLLAQCLRKQQNIQVPIGVSFTMKGRWYQPKIDDYENADIGEYDLFKDCVVSDEDQDAIPAAFCYAKSNLTEVQFSIAAYDVNFDSSASICQPDKIVGNFTRTELLYNLNRFKRNGEDLSKDITCITIIN